MKPIPHVHLGFTSETVPTGTHICQIYTNAQERDDSLRRFLARGLRDGEYTACFSGHASPGELRAFFAEEGIALQDELDRGSLLLHGTEEVYFQDEVFNPDRMLGLLKDFHAESVRRNHPAARVIGEMSPRISAIRGGKRLLEYEARVSLQLREYPVTAVCQYNAADFHDHISGTWRDD